MTVFEYLLKSMTGRSTYGSNFRANPGQWKPDREAVRNNTLEYLSEIYKVGLDGNLYRKKEDSIISVLC